MKKELNYFEINDSYGGNQSWFRQPMMNLGGCAAATTCDTCIYLSKYMGMPCLYPYDINHLNKEDYIQFALKMKPYLRPRFGGIRTLDMYLKGASKYFEDLGVQNYELHGFSGNQPLDAAKFAVKKQIDQQLPIPFLLLKHKNVIHKDHTWHWFLVIGYEEAEDQMKIKIATYGMYHWIDFQDLWNTGYQDKGGMIILDILGGCC